MALRKCVNGAYIDMTPDEEAEILAEWAANATKPPDPPDPIDELRKAMRVDPTLLDKLKAVK